MKRRKFLKYFASLLILPSSIGYSKVVRVGFSDNGRKRYEFDKYLNGKDYSDYSSPLQRAMEYCSKNSCDLYLTGNYLITKTLIIPSGLRIVCKEGCLIQCLENEPITLLRAENASNIHIIGIELNGNVTGNIQKNYTRTARFINCNNVKIEDFTVENNADWAVSFEECDNITVRNIRVYGGGRGKPGGRDGLHFLDSSNISVDGADIVSGDDCVAVTSKYKDITNVRIENVSGSSDIGSIVIYNEEQFKDKTYSSSNVDGIFIKNISVRVGGKARDVVRVYSYNPKTSIRNVQISDVSGKSSNHAVYLGGIAGLSLSNIDALSYNQNGIYIINSKDVKLENIIGESAADKNHGVSILSSSDVKGSALSRNYDKSNRIFINKSKNIELAK